MSLGQPDATEGRQAAAEGLAQVAQSFGATQSGVQARLALASLELGRAEWAKAQAALVALVEEDDLAAPLRPLVHRGLGQAEEGQGRFKEAAEAYAEAARLAGPSLAGLIRLDQARALAAAGTRKPPRRYWRPWSRPRLPIRWGRSWPAPGWWPWGSPRRRRRRKLIHPVPAGAAAPAGTIPEPPTSPGGAPP